MTEITQQFLAGSKLVTILISSQLYALGGMYGTWIRRYVMPAVYALLISGIMIMQSSFGWWKLVYPLILCGVLHFGYGGNTFMEKLIKRLSYGILLAVAALPLAIYTHQIILFSAHAMLCISGSVALGVFNPVNARDEESIYGVMAVLLPTFMI